MASKKRGYKRLIDKSLAPHGLAITKTAADEIGRQVEAYDKEGWFKDRGEKLAMTSLLGLKAAYVGAEKGAKVIDSDHVQEMFKRLACPYPICAVTTLLRNTSVTAVVLMPSPAVDYEKFRVGVPKKFLSYKILVDDDFVDKNPRRLAKVMKSSQESASLMISQARIISSLKETKRARKSSSSHE